MIDGLTCHRSDTEEDQMDLKHAVWDVDLFLSETNQSSIKSKKLKLNDKEVKSEASLTPILQMANVHFDDGDFSSPAGPSPGEVLQALTT